MRLRKRAVVFAAASVAVVAGCSTFMSSTVVTDSTDAGEPVQIYSLPRGLIQIEAKKKDQTTDRIVVVAPMIVADQQYRFRVNYNGNWFSSDALKLSTKDGLLESLWSRTQDRTYEVAVNLARSIGAVQGFTVSPGHGTVPSDKTSPGPFGVQEEGCATIPKEKDFKLILDPYVSSAWPKWLTIDDDFGRSGAPAGPPQPVSADALKQCARGLCTRSVKPWRVRINVECDLFQDEVVYLPDERDVIAVDLNRSPLVDKRFYVLFTNGMIHEIRLSKPSSAEVLASLPEGVLRALASVPADLVQLRVNYDIKRKDLTAAELARLQQEQTLRDYLNRAAGKPVATAAGAAPAQEASGPGVGTPGTMLQPTAALPDPEDWDPSKE